MAKKKVPADVLKYFREQGRKGGKLGGKKRWEGKTAEERSQAMRELALKREAGRKEAER